METNRLFLRQRTKEMIKNWLTQSPERQMNFLGIEDPEELEIHIGQNQRILGFGDTDWRLWDFVIKESGRVIGNGGFHSWKKPHERAELGYLLYKKYWNQGFMTEAIEKIVDFGFREMNLNRQEAFISPDNIASLKLVRKMGFQKEGVLRQHYKIKDKVFDSEVYGLLKSEYFLSLTPNP